MIAPLGAGIAQTDADFVRKSHGKEAPGKPKGAYGTLAYAAAAKHPPGRPPRPHRPRCAFRPAARPIRFAMHLTLLIPDLLWPEPDDQETLTHLTCPALETLIGKSHSTRGPRQPLELALARQLGLGAPGLAPYRLLGETAAPAPGEKLWYCADPIQLQFHHERIILGDVSRLTLTADEAQALVADLNQHFADLGRFHAPHPQRWYLEAAAGLELPALPPLSAASGRQLGAVLPDSAHLARLMNELQMRLHTHPVNRAREARRQPLINGLWLWGGAALAAPGVCPHDALFAPAPLATGLARHLGLVSQAPPASLAALLVEASGTRPLVLLDCLLAASLIEDGDAWRAALTQLEADWFAPIANHLGQRITRLELISPTAFGVLHWHIRGPDRWKFWRRRKRLAHLTYELASLARLPAP